MADRGKTFSPAMVRAIIAGRKTQTRRLATPRARSNAGGAGDRIFLREHWQTFLDFEERKPRVLVRAVRMGRLTALPVKYIADGVWQDPRHAELEQPVGRLRQAMHMPRCASRITLLVEDVQIERLQKISRYDAMAEGIIPYIGPNTRISGWYPTEQSRSVIYEEPCAAYAALWNSLHTEVEQTWHDNPEVIVTTFSVVKANIDADNQQRRAA